MKSLFFLLFNCLIFVSCEKSGTSAQRISGEALGTTYHITFFAENPVPVKEGLDSIFQRVNSSMSTYWENSDISRINSGDTTVIVDSLFQKVFELSDKVYLESGGYFDPTVGDIVNMYGFGPERGLKVIDSSTVDSLMEFVGFNKITISPTGEVSKEFPEVYLDFNAIAKGYTVDLIGMYLESLDIDNYLVELGGELLAKGKNINKNAPWRIGIDNPEQTPGQRDILTVVALKNRAMATSGNYRKYRIDTLTGKKYVHTINPLTGYPEKSNLLSATVFAETCALADAYATTFMAMGLEKSKNLIEELKNVDAYLIYTEGSEMETFKTNGVHIE